MLTALGEESDRIVGLEIGADDYLPKTFSSRELLARLRAVTRRSQRIAEQDATMDLVDGDLRVNVASHKVSLAGHPVDLTALEFALLVSLLKAKGRVKTREALIEEVSDRRFDVFDRSIDVHISSLRKKLGDDPKEPRFIRTIRGVGYTLESIRTHEIKTLHFPAVEDADLAAVSSGLIGGGGLVFWRMAISFGPGCAVARPCGRPFARGRRADGRTVAAVVGR